MFFRKFLCSIDSESDGDSEGSSSATTDMTQQSNLPHAPNFEESIQVPPLKRSNAALSSNSFQTTADTESLETLKTSIFKTGRINISSCYYYNRYLRCMKQV